MAGRKTRSSKKTQDKIVVENDIVKLEIRPYEKDNLLAFATLILYDAIYIYNCKIVDGKKGPFLSYPSYEGSDGKYYNYVYLDKDNKDFACIPDLIDQWLESEE